MPVDTKHPDYEASQETWELMRDSYEGESHVKSLNIKYLPPTPSQIIDGMKPNRLATTKACPTSEPGVISYLNYLARAHYPDFFEEGVRTVIGILNAKPAKVTLPKKMEYMVERATSDGESLETLLRKMHMEVLVTGRLGLLADFPSNVPAGQPLQPYIATYSAERIINWDSGGYVEGNQMLNLVVLDETSKVRSGDGFGWEDKKQWRVLSLGDVSQDAPYGEYQVGISGDGQASAASIRWMTPNVMGQSQKEIPFVFVGPSDLDATPDKPPLKGLAELCMLIYRGEADYRNTLFMQGQDTLVIVGGLRNQEPSPDGTGAAPLRVGAGAHITLEAGGSAEFVGVGSTGLPEQRTALEADRQRAAVKTGQLLQPGKMSMESGEALKTRVAAQTATLTSVAIATAKGLEKALRYIAKWLGEDPEVVTVSPNLEFTNYQIQGQDVVQLVTAKRLGAPISARTIHDILLERGLTRMTWDQELDALKSDPEILDKYLLAANADTGNNPTASAGGPQKSTQGKKPQTSVPKK